MTVQLYGSYATDAAVFNLQQHVLIQKPPNNLEIFRQLWQCDVKVGWYDCCSYCFDPFASVALDWMSSLLQDTLHLRVTYLAAISILVIDTAAARRFFTPDFLFRGLQKGLAYNNVGVWMGV